MKTTTIRMMICLTLPWAAMAQELKLAELKTVDGRVYTAVTVTKIEPDGLRIIHESGTAKVPFAKLSEEICQEYGYDPDAAEEHRQMTEARERTEALAAAVNDAGGRVRKASSGLLETIRTESVAAWVKIQQNAGGEFCLCRWGRVGKRPVVSDSGLSPRVTGHRLTDGEENDEMIAVIGLGQKADGETWRGFLFPCGVYTYESVGSGPRTVRRYATTAQGAFDVMTR